VARYEIGILDVKEPNRGSLGAADPSVLQQIGNLIDPSIAKSFSAGELADWIAPPSSGQRISFKQRFNDSILNHFQFVKVGLAGMGGRTNWQTQWQELFCSLPETTRAVLVCYLDHPCCFAPVPEEIIEFAANQPHCAAVLLDTCQKSGNLFTHLSERQLTGLVKKIHQHKLISVVAGSVDVSCLANVRRAEPNFIRLRGAVGRQGRATEIDEPRIRNFLTCPAG
jgi:uncharacterized protein (UPF0264 family)